VRLGWHLYAHLVCIRPNGAGFPVGELLQYDICRIDGDGGRQSLLAGDAEILYPGEALPGFVIPSRLTQVLHGSCRKPHAGQAWGQL